MRIARACAAGAILAALGCSGETVPTAANLSGTWDFSYVTKSAEKGATCNGTMTFTISQTDQTFTGLQRDAGTLTCDVLTLNLPNANASDPAAFTGETIGSGVVSPDEVAFRLNLLKSQDIGIVVQNGLMTGTTTLVMPVKPFGTVTTTGTWTAIKQNQ